MALFDAIKFLGRVKTSSSFRDSLYTYEKPIELDKYIKSEGYNFSYSESEDAYRKMLLACQDEDEAHTVKELYNMYRILMGMRPLMEGI